MWHMRRGGGGGGGGTNGKDPEAQTLYRSNEMEIVGNSDEIRNAHTIITKQVYQKLMNLFRLPPPVAKSQSTRQYIVNQHVVNYSKGVRKRELV